MVALLLLGADTFHFTQARGVASAHLFSVAQWEVTNFPRKWLHLLGYVLPGNKPTREERLEQLDEYLLLARLARKERDRLEGRLFRRSTTLAGAAGKQRATSREYLDELVASKEELRAEAEEAIEAELSAVLFDEGLGSRLGLLFPPVDLRFDEPPTVLVTSPRDRIQLKETVLLRSELPVLERDRLEKEMVRRFDTSALVDDLAGLSTYPALVSELRPLRSILQTAAHEWLHHYLFFRALGWHYRKSSEMFTLNETVADLAGRELGDAAFARMGGDLSVSPSRFVSAEDRNPNFTREMRKTRAHVEKLLAEGKVDEAEQYMKERWWFLALRGFRLRKLNQAYFAFRGGYGESPASLSPIGDQVEELRGMFPTVGSFIRAISGVSDYGEFLALLDSLRPPEQHTPSQDGSQSPSTSTESAPTFPGQTH